jgi:hypothetical protein
MKKRVLGKSIDSARPRPQNAAVVVDTETRFVVYTPMYYAFKHFSHFVQPGAVLLNATLPANGRMRSHSRIPTVTSLWCCRMPTPPKNP